MPRCGTPAHENTQGCPSHPCAKLTIFNNLWDGLSALNLFVMLVPGATPEDLLRPKNEGLKARAMERAIQFIFGAATRTSITESARQKMESRGLTCQHCQYKSRADPIQHAAKRM